MTSLNVIAMIPARMGSTRLKAKNLALLQGKPLIAYAIQAAKEAHIFSRIVVNSEAVIFEHIANRYEIQFYKRPVQLAASDTKSDAVVYDFLKNNACDVIVWVNTTSPLQTGEEIRKVVNYFLKEQLDSLITVKEDQVHCVYQNKPINFSLNEKFSQTQDIIPVNPFVYSLMMWRADIFKQTFEMNGYAFFCGKIGFYPVDKFSAIVIKRREDLMLAESLLAMKDKEGQFEVSYDEILHE